MPSLAILLCLVGWAPAASSLAATPAPPASSSAGAAHDPGHLPVEALQPIDRILEAKKVFVRVDGQSSPACEAWNMAPTSVVDDQHGSLRLDAAVATEPALTARFALPGLAISEPCAALGKEQVCAPCDAEAPKVTFYETDEAHPSLAR